MGGKKRQVFDVTDFPMKCTSNPSTGEGPSREDDHLRDEGDFQNNVFGELGSRFMRKVQKHYLAEFKGVSSHKCELVTQGGVIFSRDNS